MGRTLLDKVWENHTVKTLPSGQDQLFIGLHLIHEVTSPQAFGMLKDRNLKVLHPERTFATVDHIIPTDSRSRPLEDPLAEEMMRAIEQNTEEHDIRFYGFDSKEQGIVHVIGPELGLTQPGMTIACGDSHTSTHGAFGAIAFGIGTSQIRDVLATQTLAMSKPKVRLIKVNGSLGIGVSAKDIILRIVADLGVKGGIGYAYEFGGTAITNLSMEGRMTLCNMAIEGGARVGYVNPDETTFAYLEGKEYTPRGDAFARAKEYWSHAGSDADAKYDDVYEIDAATLEPMVTWGINPGQALGISKTMPIISDLPEEQQETAERAYEHMGFAEGAAIEGQTIDVAFIGSCTNGRISDLREAAKVAKGRMVSANVKAIVVPGSGSVANQAKTEGLDAIFTRAGFEWREAGCSMCLAMNPDKLSGRQISASSSNRNFIGRQGSPSGRTLLMSPAMVAAAAIHGHVSDVRVLAEGDA